MLTKVIRLRAICKHARSRKRVRITYKKGNGRVVHRDVAFYSKRGEFLCGTDTRHGNKKIRSYRLDRLLRVELLDTRFEPEWEIEL